MGFARRRGQPHGRTQPPCLLARVFECPDEESSRQVELNSGHRQGVGISLAYIPCNCFALNA